MAETGLWAAALLACAPALMGNRTATALLCSLLYAKGLEVTGVPFSVALWLPADLFVLAVICGRNMSLQDKIVAALFVPAWWAYFCDEATSYAVLAFVVTSQFLVVLPWPWLQRGLCSYSHGPRRPGVQ